jgi:hypothetical protein
MAAPKVESISARLGAGISTVSATVSVARANKYANPTGFRSFRGSHRIDM